MKTREKQLEEALRYAKNALALLTAAAVHENYMGQAAKMMARIEELEPKD